MPKLEAVEFCQQVCENCMFTCCSGNFDKSRKGELRCLTHPSSNVQFFKFVADVHRTTRSFAAALICTGQKMARNASQKMVRNSPEPSSSRAAQARNAPELSSPACLPVPAPHKYLLTGMNDCIGMSSACLVCLRAVNAGVQRSWCRLLNY